MANHGPEPSMNLSNVSTVASSSSSAISQREGAWSGYDPSPLNAASLSERMACLQEKSDGREALQTRGNHL
ncbi:hypothetical protein, partial [Parvularcula lutaonensis]|uniref:hypothetical protein n=1 Tax=Parvularcula lutaonensis TaxID=491923 RepID=UPI001E3E6EF9